MARECKDAQGNIVDCATLKTHAWKASDNPKLGNQMKEVYTPPEVGLKDESVYDKLQNEIDRGFAKEKYGYEGSDLNEYIKRKHTQKLYTGQPSKNPTQNKDLEKINKRGADISVVTGITPDLVELEQEEEKTLTIDKDPSGSDGRKNQSTMKQDPDRPKRSIDFSNITVSGDPPPMEETESSVSCPTNKPNCKYEKAVKKQKKTNAKVIKQSNRQDNREIKQSEKDMPKNKPPRKTKFSQGARASSRRNSNWKTGAGLKYNVRSLFR